MKTNSNERVKALQNVAALAVVQLTVAGHLNAPAQGTAGITFCKKLCVLACCCVFSVKRAKDLLGAFVFCNLFSKRFLKASYENKKKTPADI